MRKNEWLQLDMQSKLLAVICMLLPLVGFAVYAVFTKNLHPPIYTFPYYQTLYEQGSHGKLPWIHFNFEYPPLAMVFMFGPALLEKGLTFFQLTMVRGIWSLAITMIAMVNFLGRELSVRKIPILCLTCGLSILVSYQLYYSLFDWSVFCVLLIPLEMTKPTDRKMHFTNLLLVLGGFAKLVPGFIYLFTSSIPRTEGWFRRHLVLIIAAVVQGIYALLNIHGTMWAIRYHTSRTIDAFGLYGSLAIFVGKTGLTHDHVTFLNATQSVVGEVSNLFRKLSTLLVLAVFVICGLKFRKYLQQADTSASYRLAWLLGALTVIAFTIFGKLGQPNYCFWIVACAAIISLDPKIAMKDLLILAVGSLAFCILSTAQVTYGNLLNEPSVPNSIILVGVVKFLAGLAVMAVGWKKVQELAPVNATSVA